MKIEISSKGVNLSEKVRAQVNEKIGKIDKYGFIGDNTIVGVMLKEKGGKHTVEVTLTEAGKTIRAEETAQDLFEAINLVEQKVSRKVRKEKEKKVGAYKKPDVAAKTARSNNDTDEAEVVISNGHVVVREKHVKVEVESIGDAVESMERLGHDFHVFVNAEDNKISLVYMREDGDVGLIVVE